MQRRIKKHELLTHFLQELPLTPLTKKYRSALALRRDAPGTQDPVDPTELDAIAQAHTQEMGMQVHLLLRALGYDADPARPQEGNGNMVILDTRYDLPDAYKKITIDGEPLVADETEAKKMADQVFEAADAKAKELVSQISRGGRV